MNDQTKQNGQQIRDTYLTLRAQSDALEAEGAERVAHGLALRIEDTLLEGHMHPGLHRHRLLQFTSFGPGWLRPFDRGITPSRLATSV